MNLYTIKTVHFPWALFSMIMSFLKQYYVSSNNFLQLTLHFYPIIQQPNNNEFILTAAFLLGVVESKCD